MIILVLILLVAVSVLIIINTNGEAETNVVTNTEIIDSNNEEQLIGIITRFIQ